MPNNAKPKPTKTAEYFLREISPDDNVSGLSLGHENFAALKSFLRYHANRYHQCNAAKTYVVVIGKGGTKVIAYITLICSKIELDAAPADIGEYQYDDFPAVKIARLAVDQGHRKQGLGAKLVRWATGITTDHVIPYVGCRFLIVDAKRDSILFYKTLGFRLVDTVKNNEQPNPVMFMDLGKLA